MNAIAGLILLVGCLSHGVAEGGPASNQLGMLSDLVWRDGPGLASLSELFQKFKEVSTSEKLDERSKELAELLGALEPDDQICDPSNLAAFLQVMLKLKEIDPRCLNLYPTQTPVVKWISSYYHAIYNNCKSHGVNLPQLQEKFSSFSVFDDAIGLHADYSDWDASHFDRAVGQFRFTNPYAQAENLFQSAYSQHNGNRLDSEAWRNRKYAVTNEEKATQLLDENLLGPCKIFVDETGSTLGRYAFINAYLSVKDEQRQDFYPTDSDSAVLRWAARYLTCSWLLSLDKKAFATAIKDRAIRSAA